MKVRHDVMSKLRCPVCNKMIKENVANRKQNKDILCFKCFKVVAGVRTSREIRNNPKLRSIKRQHLPLRRVSLS
jgi:phage FluMu protein Com